MAKVLIHSIGFAPDGVSTAYLYTDLAIELKRLGHDITVLTTTPHFNINSGQSEQQPLVQKKHWLFYSEVEAIPVWHLMMPQKSTDAGTRMKQMLVFHMRALIYGILHRGSYDVILSPSPPLTIGVISWILAKKYRAKAVYNVQELYPDFAINQRIITNPLTIRMLRAVESFVYSRSTKIVTIGEQFRQTILARGVSSQKVLTIPNFVDTDLYRPMPKDNPFARQYGLVDRFVVMYAGNIGLAQYWEPLLQAAENTKSEAYYVIIGDGVKKKWLTMEVTNRRLNNVLILEYQPRERMAEINGSSDISTIIVDTRVEADGFPSKIYTTMSCGSPSVVVCSERNELAKIIRESKCGTRVNMNENGEYTKAILAYKRDPQRRVVEGEMGRAFVEKSYSKKVVGHIYHEMIQNIVNSDQR